MLENKKWLVALGPRRGLPPERLPYDEPWKGSPDNSNSEGCFGIWQVEGTSSAQNQYTLTGETLKYPLSAAQVAW